MRPSRARLTLAPCPCWVGRFGVQMAQEGLGRCGGCEGEAGGVGDPGEVLRVSVWVSDRVVWEGRRVGLLPVGSDDQIYGPLDISRQSFMIVL